MQALRNGSKITVGVKRLGDLDSKAFQVAANRLYFVEEEANERAVELCSEWENYIGDPDWNPFKTITDMRGKNKVHVQLILSLDSPVLPTAKIFALSLPHHFPALTFLYCELFCFPVSTLPTKLYCVFTGNC